MDKNNRTQSTEHRNSLINDLTENIFNTASDIVTIDIEEEVKKKISTDIKERLQFETSVLLNEAVTKISPISPLEKEVKEARKFQRFGKNFLYQHMLMFVSVIILIITGIPLKFPTFDLSKFIIIDLFGGLNNSTFVHRVGAVGLIIVSFWHLVYIIFNRRGRKDFFLMIPRPSDAVDFYHNMLYYIGKRTSAPKFGRFSFIEKFDYWAVYWGMVIMIGSGAILWFKELFPKYVFDIGREAHSDEGLLATLAIVIWHFYNVHFNPEVFPMSWVWWHGQLTEAEMKHHHPLEYAEIMKAESQQIIEEQQQSKGSDS